MPAVKPATDAGKVVAISHLLLLLRMSKYAGHEMLLADSDERGSVDGEDVVDFERYWVTKEGAVDERRALLS